MLSNKKYVTSLNNDFNISSSCLSGNISSSCLSGNSHALPQHLPNTMNFLSIWRVYFYSNATNHSAKPPCLILMWVPILSLRGVRLRDDWPRRARASSTHVLSISPVEIPCCMITPLGNAFTHVCDNCEITSKTRYAAVKIKTKAGKCFQQASSCRSVAYGAGREAWQSKWCGRRTRR